jgi:two-component system, cell cycle response regulator
VDAHRALPLSDPGPDPTRGAKTLLMVDNAPANLAVVRGTLEPVGYRIHTAADVTTGLALAERLLPHLDLILSDIHLPGRDGFDLIRAVRVHPRLRSVSVAFISSTIWAESDSHTGLSLGAVGFILRPIEPAELIAAIDGFLRRPERDRGFA